MKLNKKTALGFAKEAVNAIIKNSEVIQRHVHPKDYRNGLIVLNVIHWGLKLWEKKEQSKDE